MYRFHRLSVYSEDNQAKDLLVGEVGGMIKALNEVVNTQDDVGIITLRPKIRWSWSEVEEKDKLFDIVTRKERSRDYGKEIIYNLAMSVDMEERFGRIMSPHIERFNIYREE